MLSIGVFTSKAIRPNHARVIRNFSIDRAIKVVKLGGLIKLSDGPHKVLKITQGKRGKGGGFVKAKLKNLYSQAVFEKTFTSDENVEAAEYEKRKATYSWTDGSFMVFMDSVNFEEIRISKESAGDEVLTEGTEYKLLQCEGKYIGIDAVAMKEEE